MKEIYSNILETIGKTPLIRLNNLNETPTLPSWPNFNPGTSTEASKTAFAERAPRRNIQGKDVEAIQTARQLA